MLAFALGVAFGPLPALLGTVAGAGTRMLEAWAAARQTWLARCLAVLLTGPLAAILVLAAFFQAFYAWNALQGTAHLPDLAQAVANLPADPSPAAFFPWLEALPWYHGPIFSFPTYTLARTAVLVGAVLTLVCYAAVFMAAPRDADASVGGLGAALQTVGVAVGSIVIGLAWFVVATPPVAADQVVLITDFGQAVGTWGYLVLLGPACPMAAIVAEAGLSFVASVPGAPPAPTPRSGPLGAPGGGA